MSGDARHACPAARLTMSRSLAKVIHVLAADDVTIWYTLTVHEGQEIISVQHVSLDT